MGPDTYDLASLLRDSYVDLSEEHVDELIRGYLKLGGASQATPEAFCRIPAPFRSHVGSAQSQGARHLRPPDDLPQQSGVHPVHSAHAQLHSHEPGTIPAFARLHELLGVVVERGLLEPLFIHEDRFGVSTHLYHEQRLEQAHLLEIAAHGFESRGTLRHAKPLRLPRRRGDPIAERVAGRRRTSSCTPSTHRSPMSSPTAAASARSRPRLETPTRERQRCTKWRRR